jgi:hypothetical protein
MVLVSIGSPGIPRGTTNDAHHARRPDVIVHP